LIAALARYCVSRLKANYTERGYKLNFLVRQETQFLVRQETEFFQKTRFEVFVFLKKNEILEF